MPGAINGMAKKAAWVLLTALLGIFITVTYGKADDADKKAQTNKTDIKVMEGKIASNQELLIEKMNSIMTQQAYGFSNMEEKIGDVKTEMRMYHSGD